MKDNTRKGEYGFFVSKKLNIPKKLVIALSVGKNIVPKPLFKIAEKILKEATEKGTAESYGDNAATDFPTILDNSMQRI